MRQAMAGQRVGSGDGARWCVLFGREGGRIVRLAAMRDDGFLFYYLWIAPHVIQAAILVTLWWRKLYREFPWFFAYTVFTLTHSVVLMVMYNPRRFDTDYVVVFMVGALGTDLLRFAVVYEVFTHLVREYPAVKALARVLYRTVASVLLLVSVVLVASSSGVLNDYVSIWIHVTDRIVGITQCGLLVCLFVMSRFLRFAWRSRAFGIALGLGIYSSLQLAVVAMRSLIGPYRIEMVLNVITMSAFHVCVVVWAWYLWMPERRTAYAHGVPPSQVLEGWDAALQRVLNR